MSKLIEKDNLESLKSLLEKIEHENNEEIYEHEKAALKQIVAQLDIKESPMSAYFSLESWLHEEKNEKKPIEIKSAMVWGALFVINKMGCIDWDEMRQLYGEFMSHKMNVR